MKKALKIIGFSVLGFIVLGIVAAVLVSVFVPEEELDKVAAERAKTEQQTAPEENPPPEDSRPPGSIKKTPFERMAEKAAYNIKAPTLAQAYKDSESDADTKYKGKLVIVRGNVTNTFGSLSEYFIELKTGDSLPLVACRLLIDEGPRWQHLTDGQDVYLVGKVMGLLPSKSIRLYGGAIMLPTSTPEAKHIYWDQTPAEQGLKVGDWVTIVGYTGGLISAEAIGTNGVITGWKWTHNKIWGGQAFVAIVSQPTGLSAPADRIVNIVGFVEKPSSNREVARINEAYVKKWHEEKKGLIRVTGEISDISEPDPTNRYPGQWGMDLKTSVSVELVE